jgi:hypothetical protein
MLAKAQASALANAEQLNSSPSPTTILKSVNNSGSYMCSTARSNNDMQSPSPVVIYHESSNSSLITQMPQEQNTMMQHRNNVNISLSRLKDHHKRFDFDDENENENQKNQYQFHNAYNNYAQSQHQAISETQQQADQHTIELRMNNLGNEQQDTES